MPAPPTGPAYRAYAIATAIAAPLIEARVSRALAHAELEGARIGERRGRPTASRPEGELVWFHAVSVGEALSILRLVGDLGRARPGAWALSWFRLRRPGAVTRSSASPADRKSASW